MRLAPIFECLVPQLVELCGKDEEVWCGPIGGALSLEVGFDVSKAHAIPSISLGILFISQDVNSQLLLLNHACWPPGHHAPLQEGHRLLENVSS